MIFKGNLIGNIFDHYCITDIQKKEFKLNLRWFEEEFNLLFKAKAHHYVEEDLQLANRILDKLFETINQYQDDNLLQYLISTINKIEEEYPEFF